MNINFERECFGEKSSYATGYDGWESYETNQQHSKSAYMLVYEKKEKNPIRIVVNDTVIDIQKEN